MPVSAKQLKKKIEIFDFVGKSMQIKNSTNICKYVKNL